MGNEERAGMICVTGEGVFDMGANDPRACRFSGTCPVVDMTGFCIPDECDLSRTADGTWRGRRASGSWMDFVHCPDEAEADPRSGRRF